MLTFAKWLYWPMIFSTITAMFLGSPEVKSLAAATMFGLAGLGMAIMSHEGIAESNKKIVQSWQAPESALKNAGLTREQASHASALPEAEAIQEAVAQQRSGLLREKHLMYVVSDFNLPEVLYMADLAADALRMLGYKRISNNIKMSIAYEFDPVLRLGTKGIQRRFLELLKLKVAHETATDSSKTI